MGQHRTPPARRIAAATGATLTVGALLLAAPAATAFADLPHNGGGAGSPSGPGPGTDGPGGPPGGGSGNPGGPDDPGGTQGHGVNGRPALPRPAPLVTFGQRLGDGLFDHNSMLNGSPLGAGYHGLFGGSGTPDNGDSTRQPGEAYQGAYTGVLNQTPLGGVYDTVTNKHHSFTNTAGVRCGSSTAICR